MPGTASSAQVRRVAVDCAGVLPSLPRRLGAVADAAPPSRDLDAAFVSAVSHELRSPLASILGYGDALAEGLAGPLSPTQAQFVDVVTRSGRHLLALLDDLALLVALETGTTRLRPAVADVGALVSRLALEQAADAALRSPAIAVDVPAGGLAATIDADVFPRAVVNLLAHAVRLTPPGRTITVRAGYAGADVEVGVTHPATAGFGLGPAVARAVAEAHGGRLETTAGRDGSRALVVSIPRHAFPHQTEDSR